jgi:hypothetical protein
MRVLLVETDGKLPNLALMRVSAHHKGLGDEVVLRRIVKPATVESLATRFVGNDNFFDDFDAIYCSLIFSKTRPVAEALLRARPDAVIGGTGWDDYTSTPARITSLEQIGVTTTEVDYTLYPAFKRSLGYTQRGCRMNRTTCPWCSVPLREGKVKAVSTIEKLWRGEPYPREVHLLDNDFFGQPNWRELIEEIREGGFKVSFNQGINARMLNDEVARAVASINYYDDDFKKPQIYTAWDGKNDEHVLFRGLDALKRAGVAPDNIMVYILISFWDGQDVADWEYRRSKLRAWGARPYPMPFARTPEAVGFQRWVIGAYDKPRLMHDPDVDEPLDETEAGRVEEMLGAGFYYRDATDGRRIWARAVRWDEWVRAKYQPCNLPDRRLRKERKKRPPQLPLDLHA